MIIKGKFMKVVLRVIGLFLDHFGPISKFSGHTSIDIHIDFDFRIIFDNTSDICCAAQFERIKFTNTEIFTEFFMASSPWKREQGGQPLMVEFFDICFDLKTDTKVFNYWFEIRSEDFSFRSKASCYSMKVLDLSKNLFVLPNYLRISEKEF